MSPDWADSVCREPKVLWDAAGRALEPILAQVILDGTIPAIWGVPVFA